MYYLTRYAQWIGLTPDGGDGYKNTPLPSWNDTDPTTLIPSTTLLPFWDDLLIVNGSAPNPQSGLSQGISYSVQGDVRGRNITFEWVAGKYDDGYQHYRFWVTFYEDRPNTVTFTYWDVSDLGGSATVGAQSEQGEFRFFSPSLSIASSNTLKDKPCTTCPGLELPVVETFLDMMVQIVACVSSRDRQRHVRVEIAR